MRPKTRGGRSPLGTGLAPEDELLLREVIISKGPSKGKAKQEFMNDNHTEKVAKKW